MNLSKKTQPLWFFLIAFTPLVSTGGLNQMVLFYLVANLLIILYIIWSFKGNKFRLILPIKSRFWVLLFVFVLWSTLSLLWSTNWYVSSSILILWWNALLTAFILFQIKDEKQSLIRQMFLFSLLLLLILGLAQHLLGLNIIKQPSPPAATFKNKNMFAQIIILLWPLLCYEIMRLYAKKNVLFTTIGLITLFFSMAMLVFTASRAAWAALVLQIIALGVVFLLKKNKQMKILLFAICSLIFVVIVSFQIKENSNINTTKSKINTAFNKNNNIANNERITGWANSIDIFLDNPILGVGVGNWYIHYPLYKNNRIIDERARQNLVWNFAHNDYIEIIVSSGIVGFVLLLLLVFYFIKELVLLGIKTEKNITAIIGILGISICALFSFPFHLSTQTIIIALLLFLITPKEKIKTQIIAKEKARKMLLFFATALFISILFSYDQLRAVKYHKLAGKELSKNNYSRMLEHTTRALKLDSYSSRSLELHGIALTQLDRYVEASTLYHKYIRYYPNNVLALENGSISCLRVGNFSCAEKYIESLLQIEPNSFVANANKGVLLHYNKKASKREAIRYYEKAIAIEPNNPITQQLKAVVKELEKKISLKNVLE